MDRAEVMPMVNQLEINPRYHQTATAAFCRENGILVESWGPLARGGALEEPILRRIADKHNKLSPKSAYAGCCSAASCLCPNPRTRIESAPIWTFSTFPLTGRTWPSLKRWTLPGNYSIHPDYLSEE